MKVKITDMNINDVESREQGVQALNHFINTYTNGQVFKNNINLSIVKKSDIGVDVHDTTSSLITNMSKLIIDIRNKIVRTLDDVKLSIHYVNNYITLTTDNNSNEYLYMSFPLI